jgi:hypothetical protein
MPGIMAAVGGTIMFASVILFFVNLLMTVATGEKRARVIYLSPKPFSPLHPRDGKPGSVHCVTGGSYPSR